MENNRLELLKNKRAEQVLNFMSHYNEATTEEKAELEEERLDLWNKLEASVKKYEARKLN